MKMMWGYGNGAGYGNNGQMANWGGFGVFSIIWIITWAVFFIDLVLLGMWLWKQVKKK